MNAGQLETTGSDISLDAVVNMIDTVTEDMSYFREKVSCLPCLLNALGKPLYLHIVVVSIILVL